MRFALKNYLLFWALAMCSPLLHAQISGTVTVPSATYPDLATLVAALNAQGVGTGGAIVNITAGNNQAAPANGYLLGSTVLNASLGAARPLVINGNGNTITAQTGTGTADGVFFLQGTDYVTINALHIAENAANTTSVTQMEFGYALLKLNSAAPFDGCQNVTIKNSRVSLAISNAAGKGIYLAHAVAAAAATTLGTTGAVPSDANSNNLFTGDTVSNCTYGFYLYGIALGGVYDFNNKVGNTTAGNMISVGGSANTCYGVYTYNDSTLTLQNNRIAVAAAQSAVVYDIYTGNGKGDLSLLSNYFDMNCAIATANVYAFYNYNVTAGTGHSDAAATFTCTGNTITGTNTAATSSYLYGIYNYYANFATVQISNNNISNINWSASTGYLYLLYSYYNAANNFTASNNTIYNISKTGTSGYIYAMYCYQANATGGTMTITNNSIRKLKNNYYVYGLYTAASTAATQVMVNKYNKIDSIDVSGASSGATYLMYTYYGLNADIGYDSVTNIFAGPCTVYNYLGYYSMNGEVHDNYYNNIQTTTGSWYNYSAYYSTNINYHHNLFSNIVSSSSGSIYNYMGYYGYGGAVHDNKVTGLSTGSGTLYGMYVYANTPTVVGTLLKVYNNNINNLSITSGTTNTFYGVYLGGAGTASPVAFYNNFITGLNVPAAFNAQVYGVYCGAAVDYSIYYNTVRLTTTGSGTAFGATGLYYLSTANSLDLRNNIFNINATPGSAGFTTAVRRSAGTAGTVPSNLLPASNSNIYYVPAATNSYFYGEGTSTPLANAYSLATDPGFNTPCGLYKKFMTPRESGSGTENNLVQLTAADTYAPTGSSWAKNSAAQVTMVTTDYNGVARPAAADIGALQFTGTTPATDLAPPVISYTALPVSSYCTTPPTLITTITDNNAVSTASGTAPRVYYKKSTDADAFGVANTSAGNGWKWVEATASGNAFTFNFDYTKLQSAVAVGDSITYFVIAQDNATTPNVSTNVAGLAATYCATSVSLPAAAGPTVASPAANGFKVLAVPAFTAAASITSICVSGATVLTVTPVPVGAAVQWQQDNGTGTYSNISGATGSTYSIAALTATNNFRALVLCSNSTIATSTTATVTVTSPQVTSTAPATRCGIGTLTLGATGANLKWYSQAAGGTPIATGGTYTTPSLSATTTYYVTASELPHLDSLGKMTPVTTSGNSGFSDIGLVFDAYTTFTLQSVNVYPMSTTSTSGTVTIDLKNAAGTTLQSATANVVVSSAGTLNVVPLNFVITPGTSYRLVVTGATGISNLLRESTPANINYPYTLAGVASITSAYTSGPSSAYYYYLYSWKVMVGCESARVPVTATIGSAPAITASVNPAVGICPGGTATVSVTSANTNYTYSWSSGNTTPSFSASPAVTTKYVVTATDTAAACVIKDSVNLVVNVQSAVITPASGTNICTGATVQLNANTAASQTYQWYLNGNAISGATNASYTTGTAGSYTVRVTNTSTTCTALSAAVTVTVSPPPVSSVTPSGNINICTGSQTTLSGPVAAGYTYQWMNGSANASGAANGSTYTTGTAGTYTLIVYANGCATTSPATTVTLLPLPVAQMSPAVPATGCDSVVLTTATGTGVRYQWNYNGIPILNGTQSTYGANVTANYSLTVTSLANGCAATTAATAITVNPSPLPTITYSSPITFCSGGAVVLNTYTAANQAYQWYRDSVTIPGATTPSLIADASGRYSVRVVNTQTGCASAAQAVIVKVNPSPVPVISYTAATNTLATTQPYMVYQWQLNSQPVSGATRPTYNPVHNGAYALTVTDSNGCVNVSEIFFVNSLGVQQTALGASIGVYPNPTNGILYVRAAETVQLRLADVTGKTILKGDSAAGLDLAPLADGLYLLYIHDGAGRLIRGEKITKTSR